ncbi:MAG TPA: hypothetical protein VIY54_14345 [Steroidobacteraceae bacterium]
METDDLKRTLDDAMNKLQTMHHAAVAQLQKANEAEEKEYVKFLEAQIELIAQASKGVESAMNTKSVPFI